MYSDRDSYQKSVRRAREERWRVRGRARVVHPKYGAVVVPHRSNYSALLNAAEYWGCEWTDICTCGNRRSEPCFSNFRRFFVLISYRGIKPVAETLRALP